MGGRDQLRDTLIGEWLCNPMEMALGEDLENFGLSQAPKTAYASGRASIAVLGGRAVAGRGERAIWGERAC